MESSYAEGVKPEQRRSHGPQWLWCSEFEPSLCCFFVAINNILKADRSVNGYSTITLEAPDLPEKFIHQSFMYVGESIVPKNIVPLLAKVLKMEKVIYHTITRAEDRKSIYILSKQHAL